MATSPCTTHRAGILWLAAATLLPAATGLAQAKDPAGFEAAPALPGATLAREALFSGPLHKVAQPVRVEGHLGLFVIESKFGKFHVRGSELLAMRVHELGAIAELQKVQSDSAFKDALAKSAAGMASFAADAVADPGKTAESIEKGIGTVLGTRRLLGQVREATTWATRRATPSPRARSRSPRRRPAVNPRRPPSPATRWATTRRAASGRRS